MTRGSWGRSKTPSLESAAEAGDWLEVAVEVAGIDAETVADIFRQACEGGTAIQPSSRLDRNTDTYVLDGDAPAVVRGYLRPGPEADRVQNSLRIAVASAPLTRDAQWRDPSRLKETSWRDEWKKHFGLQRIGRSLIVRPSWVRYEMKRGDVVIDIDPGMAFGTGQHPTTAMCLRALEEFVEPGSSVLDLGCGSGILAVAAARLGASRILAVDNDAQAVAASLANVAANSVSASVEVREGTLDAASERFDLVVANISGLTLERLSSVISESLNDGGRLIASGFLQDAIDGLRDAFSNTGMVTERIDEDGVWRAMIARRGDA